MSAYEQRQEPPDRKWQYLLFAAEPYETIAFKVGVVVWNGGRLKDGRGCFKMGPERLVWRFLDGLCEVY